MSKDEDVSSETTEEVVEEPETIIEEPPEKTPEPKWPENWREQIAGDDEKALKQLQRYSRPDDLYKKARSLEQKLSSGEYKMTLSKEPTEEELKEFRAVNGIPEKPEEYDLTFDDGFVPGEEDKEIIGNFLKEAHSANMHPDQVKQAVRWYYSEQERQAEEIVQKDAQIREESEDFLRGEWGNDYRNEVKLARDFLSSAPQDLRDSLLAGRLSDGTKIADSKEFILWMNYLAREMNPLGTLTAPGNESAMQSLEGRIKELQHIMRTDRARYNRDHLDKELMALTAKMEKAKGRAA